MKASWISGAEMKTKRKGRACSLAAFWWCCCTLWRRPVLLSTRVCVFRTTRQQEKLIPVKVSRSKRDKLSAQSTRPLSLFTNYCPSLCWHGPSLRTEARRGLKCRQWNFILEKGPRLTALSNCCRGLFALFFLGHNKKHSNHVKSFSCMSWLGAELHWVTKASKSILTTVLNGIFLICTSQYYVFRADS